MIVEVNSKNIHEYFDNIDKMQEIQLKVNSGEVEPPLCSENSCTLREAIFESEPLNEEELYKERTENAKKRVKAIRKEIRGTKSIINVISIKLAEEKGYLVRLQEEMDKLNYNFPQVRDYFSKLDEHESKLIKMSHINYGKES
jgi:hypothetical protein